MKGMVWLTGAILLSLPFPLLADGPVFCTGKTGEPGEFVQTITSGGWTRQFRLHVPASYRPTVPVPLVLAFHGWGDNAENFEQYIGFSDKADEEGFIVAYPDGIDNSFNAGACCGTANHLDVDDVGFARDIVATVFDAYCVDPSRVYATGFSNGALMSHRLACEASDLFAAVAPASGFIAEFPCEPPRPVPVIQTQGTMDTSVPYWTAKRSNDYWAAYNGCDGTETVYQKGTATCVAYQDCDQGATVEFCEIRGMGHVWPSTEGPPYWLDATDTFWAFFEQHVLEQP